tara:strand:+ start:370 stop:687 length:318 start_codon:yes stop_codon:yes gene_type:complete
MDWMKDNLTKVIATVGLISTISGFGYAGAELMGRLKTVEDKVSSISSTKNSVVEIEKRFEGIEVKLINLKEGLDNVDDKTILVDLAKLKTEVKGLQEKSSNPLAK